MTNGNDIVQAKQLELSTAAVKRYLLTQITNIAEAVLADIGNLNSKIILDNNASLKNGKLWYELSDGTATLKLQHNEQVYSFASSSVAILKTTKVKSSIYVSMIPFGVMKVKPSIYVSMIPATNEE